MQDQIEKTMEVNAPLSRVWQAITDHEAFGTWFRVDLEGPFVVGEISRGQMTYPGCEHMKWKATVIAMEPERLFSFRWCPYETDPDEEEATTLVVFALTSTEAGTRVTITESGFAALPAERRADALRSNTEGWDEQAKNLTAHVER